MAADLDSLAGTPVRPTDPRLQALEDDFFATGPVVAACPSQLRGYVALAGRLREVIKDQSRHWDPDQLEARQRLYRLLYGARAAVEEAMLQHPDSSPALLLGRDEPSATPSALVHGVRIHSGDMLVSRGGYPTSALIARGNDYPGNFSHVGLVYIDSATRQVSVIEAHIEIGVAVSSAEQYLADKKLRVMVLRPRADLPALEADPMLPHRAASRMLARARAGHIPYDFTMDYSDPSHLFCSEVASSAYHDEGITLWMGRSTISRPGIRRWLSELGVRHFETQEPSDLEYDPQLVVVAEWRDSAALWQDHLDNAVLDAMLDQADEGRALDHAWYRLPLVRLAKGYSWVLVSPGRPRACSGRDVGIISTGTRGVRDAPARAGGGPAWGGCRSPGARRISPALLVAGDTGTPGRRATSMNDSVEQLAAALADRYRIERELGQGGMATVYLAEDLKHHRKVAIKVLRPELAAVIGAERFLSEIRTTANLQHPHILPLFDSGEAGSFLFYVMPYVEGESLRDRLAREKQLPIGDAVRIAGEVASALDYAHRHGVIHRDIKPENVMLHDGQALVADFGIALAVSKTAGTRMTETGMSLGTPHYMSPEQAMGEREITAQSDVYALGAMTYEMLAGEPPFTGPTAQAIVAKVVTAEPVPLRDVRKTVPEHVDAAVLTALQKLPADRFASTAAFASALSGATTIASSTSGTRERTGSRHRPLSRLMNLAGWIVAVLAVALWLWGRLRSEPSLPSQFAVGFPPDQAPSLSMLGTHMAVSRDGSILVYTGGDSVGGRLWLKHSNTLNATPIPGTEGAYDPFISPDGRQVGFVTDRDGRIMKVVQLGGGMPRTVVGAPLGTSGAYWASDGYIYFDADVGGLQRVRPDGSDRGTVAPLDTLQHETGIAWPQILPGNRVALFRLRHANDAPGDFSIMAWRLGTGEHRVVTQAVSARYAAGYLLFVTVDGTLQAAPFDEGRLALTAPPRAVASGTRISGTYAGVDLAASDDGALYYVAGSPGATSRLDWVAGDGTAHPVDRDWREGGEIRGVALSPDGQRVAVELSRAGTTGTDIWIKQLPSGPLTRFTLDPAPDVRPSWAGDGRSILFISERVHPQAVFRKQADGTGGVTLVVRSDRDITEVGESPDGQWLVVRTSGAQAGSGDILGMRLGSDTTLQPLITGPAAETNPVISPDGHRIAYVSTASGRREVYVRPFPDVNRGVWQVSTDGGVEPRWAHSGKELFFRAISTLDLMAVEVDTNPVFRSGAPHALFHSDAATGLDYARYAVAPDDRHFLMVGQGTDAPPQLVRIEHFTPSLKWGPAP